MEVTSNVSVNSNSSKKFPWKTLMLFCFCYFKSLICWFVFFCLSNKYYSRPHCFFASFTLFCLLWLDLHQMWHFGQCFPFIFNAFWPKLLKTSASDWKLRVAQLFWLRSPCHAAGASHILQRSDTYTNTMNRTTQNHTMGSVFPAGNCWVSWVVNGALRMWVHYLYIYYQADRQFWVAWTEWRQ